MEEIRLQLTGFLNQLQAWGVLKQFISSGTLIASVIFLRWLGIRLIARWRTIVPEEKRRWIVQIKNVSILLLIVGMFGIWLTELREFAISLVAVAAALAIATKEVISCFMGGIYKASAHPFEIGDRIEINNVRGEVIDHSLLATVLLEIGPFDGVNQHSGRYVAFPNSWLMLYPVANQTVQQEYVLHNMRIPMSPDEDWQTSEEILLEAANQECASYLEPARWSMVRLGQIQGLDLPRVEPRVSVNIEEQGRIVLILRVPALAAKINKSEQAILRAYMKRRNEKMKRTNKDLDAR